MSLLFLVLVIKSLKNIEISACNTQGSNDLIFFEKISVLLSSEPTQILSSASSTIHTGVHVGLQGDDV
ncbi:hypothetical protein K1719_006579 [Acacia pycnantha]|nr:hypothetical protein K1719_006579 [Acacia pycnantha]